nr:MAG TPA: TNF receptor-associated factor BIRC3 binding domain [Caudoviricetes sp.]
MQSKATAVLQVKLDALRNDVDTLSRRVDKHNNLIDRMTIAECKIKELESEVQRNEKS